MGIQSGVLQLAVGQLLVLAPIPTFVFIFRLLPEQAFLASSIDAGLPKMESAKVPRPIAPAVPQV